MRDWQGADRAIARLAQIMPLSKVLDSMMEETAIWMSALLSIMAGVLPEPTPSAAWPEE